MKAALIALLLFVVGCATSSYEASYKSTTTTVGGVTTVKESCVEKIDGEVVNTICPE